MKKNSPSNIYEVQIKTNMIYFPMDWYLLMDGMSVVIFYWNSTNSGEKVT